MQGLVVGPHVRPAVDPDLHDRQVRGRLRRRLIGAPVGCGHGLTCRSCPDQGRRAPPGSAATAGSTRRGANFSSARASRSKRAPVGRVCTVAPRDEHRRALAAPRPRWSRPRAASTTKTAPVPTTSTRRPSVTSAAGVLVDAHARSGAATARPWTAAGRSGALVEVLVHDHAGQQTQARRELAGALAGGDALVAERDHVRAHDAGAGGGAGHHRPRVGARPGSPCPAAVPTTSWASLSWLPPVMKMPVAAVPPGRERRVVRLRARGRLHRADLGRRRAAERRPVGLRPSRPRPSRRWAAPGCGPAHRRPAGRSGAARAPAPTLSSAPPMTRSRVRAGPCIRPP